MIALCRPITAICEIDAPIHIDIVKGIPVSLSIGVGKTDVLLPCCQQTHHIDALGCKTSFLISMVSPTHLTHRREQ